MSLQNKIKSPNAAGLHRLILARFVSVNGNEEVNFHLQTILCNPGSDYLSAGESPLHVLRFLYCLLRRSRCVMCYGISLLWLQLNSASQIPNDCGLTQVFQTPVREHTLILHFKSRSVRVIDYILLYICVL